MLHRLDLDGMERLGRIGQDRRYLGGSINWATPKSFIFIGFSLNHPFRGTPIDGNPLRWVHSWRPHGTSWGIQHGVASYTEIEPLDVCCCRCLVDSQKTVRLEDPKRHPSFPTGTACAQTNRGCDLLKILEVSS